MAYKFSKSASKIAKSLGKNADEIGEALGKIGGKIDKNDVRRYLSLNKTESSAATGAILDIAEGADGQMSFFGGDIPKPSKPVQVQAPMAEVTGEQMSFAEEFALQDDWNNLQAQQKAKAEKAAKDKAKSDFRNSEKYQNYKQSQQKKRMAQYEAQSPTKGTNQHQNPTYYTDSEGQLTLFGPIAGGNSTEPPVRKYTLKDGRQVEVTGGKSMFDVVEEEEKKIEKEGLPKFDIEGQHDFLVNSNNDMSTQDAVNRAARQAEVDALTGGTKSKPKKRTLGEWAGQVIRGDGDALNPVSGRNTRKEGFNAANEAINKANQAYIDTGTGNAQSLLSKREYKRKLVSDKANAEKGANTWTNTMTGETYTEPNSNTGLGWDGIADWVKDHQLLTAGALVAGTIGLVNILDDDDDY